MGRVSLLATPLPQSRPQRQRSAAVVPNSRIHHPMNGPSSPSLPLSLSLSLSLSHPWPWPSPFFHKDFFCCQRTDDGWSVMTLWRPGGRQAGGQASGNADGRRAPHRRREMCAALSVWPIFDLISRVLREVVCVAITEDDPPLECAL